MPDIVPPTSLEELRAWHVEQSDVYQQLMHSSEARDEVEYYHKMSVFHARAYTMLTTPQFPTMLRKMWSGGEVQDWLNRVWGGKTV